MMDGEAIEHQNSQSIRAQVIGFRSSSRKGKPKDYLGVQERAGFALLCT
jgi:hypothetical protein